MFDRFTERARKVMTLARQEAQKLNNDYIGTEHILMGLVQEGSGVAAQVLKNLDVDLRKVRAEVERLVEQGNAPVKASQLPFTPRAKRVLELALDEAQNLGHNYIGTEHLLLGLIRESDGPAAHVLQNLGVSPEDVREEVIELLGVEFAPGGTAVAPGLYEEVQLLQSRIRGMARDRFPGAQVEASVTLPHRPGGLRIRLVMEGRVEGRPPVAGVSILSVSPSILERRLPAIFELFAEMLEEGSGHKKSDGDSLTS